MSGAGADTNMLGSRQLRGTQWDVLSPGKEKALGPPVLLNAHNAFDRKAPVHQQKDSTTFKKTGAVTLKNVIYEGTVP